MSHLDFDQGGSFLAPREWAIVSILFIFRIIQNLVACNEATQGDGVRYGCPVTLMEGPGPSPIWIDLFIVDTIEA
jgi:hypothetical protein